MVERYGFTQDSAQRIAKVVRKVEQGDRGAQPLRFDRALGVSAGDSIKFCSWQGDWSHGGTKTITFYGSAGTAMASNYFLGVGSGDGWVAKRGTTGWSLVSADLTQQADYDGSQIQLFGHGDDGIAIWYSIATCATVA